MRTLPSKVSTTENKTASAGVATGMHFFPTHGHRFLVPISDGRILHRALYGKTPTPESYAVSSARPFPDAAAVAFTKFGDGEIFAASWGDGTVAVFHGTSSVPSQIWHTWSYHSPSPLTSTYNLSNLVPLMSLHWSPNRPAVFFVQLQNKIIAFDLLANDYLPVVEEIKNDNWGPDVPCKSKLLFSVVRDISTPAKSSVIISHSENNIIIRRELGVYWSCSPLKRAEEDELVLLKEVVERAI